MKNRASLERPEHDIRVRRRRQRSGLTELNLLSLLRPRPRLRLPERVGPEVRQTLQHLRATRLPYRGRFVHDRPRLPELRVRPLSGRRRPTTTPLPIDNRHQEIIASFCFLFLISTSRRLNDILL